MHGEWLNFQVKITHISFHWFCTGDPLVSGVPDLVGYVPYSLMPGYYQHAMMLPPPPAEQRSPIVSRTNSPCQSNSPSRPGSPGRPKNLPQTFTRPPPAVESPGVKPSMDQVRVIDTTLGWVVRTTRMKTKKVNNGVKRRFPQRQFTEISRLSHELTRVGVSPKVRPSISPA